MDEKASQTRDEILFQLAGKLEECLLMQDRELSAS